MAKPNVTVRQGNPPFMPPAFVQQPANLLGGGGPSPLTGPFEDGPGSYVNYDGVSPVAYNGQTQTGTMNVSYTKPPRNFSPGAADKSMSKIP